VSRRVSILALLCALALPISACNASSGFEVRALAVNPPHADVGQEVIVTAEICNLGSDAATYDAVLTIDGVETKRASVSMAGGASAGVTFTLVRNTPGTYQVDLGDMSATLVVGEEENTQPEEPGEEVTVAPADGNGGEGGEPDEVGGETALEIHQRAWEQAATNCASDNYYKYSLYSSRSLAVSHPEVYLQADAVWMDMICNSGGWSANYLLRDREVPDAGWWDEIEGAINDGFRRGKTSGSFDWSDFNWQEHRENAVDLFDFYEDADCFDWLDNRMVFVWSAMKGLHWRMPFTSLAEAQYLQMLSEGKEVYLLLTANRKGYVAELAGGSFTLHDPLTAEPTEDPDANVVLVMNNEHVWYPLMLRDDRAEDPGLAKVVERCCNEGALPLLSENENSLIDGLAEGTALGSSVNLAWAKLIALRGLNQYTWRAQPLRELSAELFPERHDEDSGYSDSPQEQQCLGMVITEMGNRLSPTAAGWAQVVQQNRSNPRDAFEQLGGAYLEQFHRTDSHSDWVYGDFYHCWLPNVEDKLVSGLGTCFVEAGNTMAALGLAAVEEWQVYETNWWSLERSGGHVICGAYTPDGNYSLSNGLFQIRDQCVLNGPLWEANGRLAQEMIYNPEVGFVAFVQTKNAADYSDFDTPFTNLTFEEAVAFLQHLKTLESGALIAEEFGAQQARSIDEYLEYIATRGVRWEDNMADWAWHVGDTGE
jgi:hypothetical protein